MFFLLFFGSQKIVLDVITINCYQIELNYVPENLSAQQKKLRNSRRAAVFKEKMLRRVEKISSKNLVLCKWLKC